MKLTFKTTLLLLVVISAFTACKKEDPVNNNKLIFTSAKTNYLGNFYRNKVNTFETYFFDRNLSTDADGYIIGTGTFLFLDINTNANATSIPTSTYYVNNGNSNQSIEYTFQRGKMSLNSKNENVPTGSYFAMVENGVIKSYIFLTSGSIVFSKQGNYSVTGEVTSDNNYFYEFSFSGNIPVTDLVTPYPETLTKGQLWYWGDIDNVNLNIYTIWLADNNRNMTDMSGYGDLMRIEVYTPTFYTTSLPNGTYPVKVNTVENQTIIDGFNNTTEDLGTWYYTADAFPITGGSMTVVKGAGASNYNLNYSFIDELGNAISGSYNGNLPLINKQNTSSGAPSRAQKIKATRADDTENNPYSINVHRGKR